MKLGIYADSISHISANEKSLATSLQRGAKAPDIFCIDKKKKKKFLDEYNFILAG